ncbi:hypothetical protein GCM10020001_015040 [Nonomuraea salmonea]
MLDLDHPGAQVAEQLCGVRPRQRSGQIEHDDATERPTEGSEHDPNLPLRVMGRMNILAGVHPLPLPWVR